MKSGGFFGKNVCTSKGYGGESETLKSGVLVVTQPNNKSYGLSVHGQFEILPFATAQNIPECSKMLHAVL